MAMCNSCFSQFDEDFDICPDCGYRQGDPPPEPFHLFAGTWLNDRYIVGKVLGFGGFGITYKAYDTKLDMVVAIKEYYPSGIVNRSPGTAEVIIYATKRLKEFDYGKERFLDEAKNMAKYVSDPNIVNVFDFFEANNTAYIVMEFLDGIDLNTFLKNNGGRVDVDTGLEITESICNALKKLHADGIIHRDVAPDNIFVCVGGAIKLIDFGTARFSKDEETQLTIILKPGFAPPEQYEKINKQGPWTDVYAMGATLYYIITGEKPEESTNRKTQDTLPYPQEINPKIPEYLGNAIMKAMAIDLYLRFKNVDEFLAAIYKNKKVMPVAVEKKRRKTKRLVGMVTAFAVLAGGITLGLHEWDKEKEAETLPDCEITMWYCKSGDEDYDDAELAAYQAIVEDFNESYSNVKINIEGYTADEYSQKLESGEQPNIYEYEEVSSCGESLPLDDVYDSDAAKQCIALNNAQKSFGNSFYLPLGYNVPVIYVNSIINDYSGNSVKSASDLDGKIKCAIDISESLNGIRSAADKNSRETFFDGDLDFYGSDTSEYFDVRENLPAQYRLLSIDSDEVHCSYADIWCANDVNDDENKASLRLLEFMLNNNAQDELHVKNICRSLPVNDAVLDVFVEVYDDFEDFFENKDNYVFE